ncbi:hypothetical protein P9222_10475 [Paenibacillus amylolyticus]|nr:hypothetical protein [Paenibacillus amylolyticus]WFR64514.1 hypothetical protein P9222_10475 [Paenibacillus amylolyticus]
MKFTVFAKTVILLICLLVPILLLYTYANQANVDMVVEEKQQSSLNQFNYFSSQVDKNIEQLLIVWPDIAARSQYPALPLHDGFNQPV